MLHDILTDPRVTLFAIIFLVAIISGLVLVLAP